MTTDDVRTRAQGYRFAGIPNRYFDCTFENFVAYHEKLQRAKTEAQRFAEQWESTQRGLCFGGRPGVGKTHLAVAVLKHALDTQAHGVFWNARRLLREVARDPRLLDRDGGILGCDLLVLDNLGEWRDSEMVDDVMGLIIETRYDNKSLTIFTSNYPDLGDPTDPVALIARIGFRLRSRVAEMCTFVDLDGADYRDVPPTGFDEADLLRLWKIQKEQRTKRRF